MPTVISVINTSQIGSPDPSGLAYDPISGGLFLVDSEVDETPFFSTTNLLALNLDGTLREAYSFTSVSNEPTGVAVDPATGRLFVTDDDLNTVYQVDQANPTTTLGSFSTDPLGSNRASDIAMGSDGTLFVLDQSTRTIYQTTPDGELVSGVPLPSSLKRPEALAYDPEEDVFYVAGGWSADIFKVSRTGEVLEKITVLRDHRLPDGGHAVPKGLALAPATDGSGMSLWVADYGADQVSDGRLFEISLNDVPPPPPPPALPAISILDGAPIAQSEESGGTVDFVISLSAPASEDVVIAYSTVSGTATAGSDFVDIANGQAVIAAGEQVVTVSVQLIDDSATESAESFSVQLNSAALADSGSELEIVDGSGGGTIDVSDKVFSHDATAFGSPDPAGLTFDWTSGRLLLVDSEVDEDPFSSDINMFALDTQGNFLEGFGLTDFSEEPTGVAYWRDPTTGQESIFVTDDDEQAVFRFGLDDPSTPLDQFSTLTFGCTDPEDIAVNPLSGNLFLIGEGTKTIYETTQSGSLVSTVVLPERIKRPEAIAYDADTDSFYVSGGWSADIFNVDRSGAIVDIITDLRPYRLPDGFHAVPKGLVLASASDGIGQSLWVADYGRDEVGDGRIFEIRMEDAPMMVASTEQTTASDDLLLG